MIDTAGKNVLVNASRQAAPCDRPMATFFLRDQRARAAGYGARPAAQLDVA